MVDIARNEVRDRISDKREGEGLSVMLGKFIRYNTKQA